MTFQTPQNDQANRYKNNSEELSDEICSIWLGRRATKITLVEDPGDDTQAIRELLDESVSDEAEKSC